MTKESFFLGLEAVIEEAAKKIKPLLLSELQGVQLPFLEVGVYDSRFQQEGIPTGGNHWRGDWRGDWKVAPSEGVAVEMPGYVLNPNDASYCVQGYVVLTPEGIFQMKKEPFFDGFEKKYTSNLPSWNSRKEVPQHYIDYAKTAFGVIAYLKMPKEQQAYARADF